MRRAVAKGRVFPQSYSTDRRYGRLSLKAGFLFPMLWANADDQGRLSGDPEDIKYAVCPNIGHITKADIPETLKDLEGNKLIKLYQTPKSVVIQLLDWWEVQKPQWAYPSEYPPPGSWKDRLRYHPRPDQIITENWVPPSQWDRELPSALPSKEGGNELEKLPSQLGSLETTPPQTPPLEEGRGKREKGILKVGSALPSNQVAKKPPAPFSEDRAKIFEGLKERRGYSSPMPGAEAKATTWMLKQGYTGEQILGAYDALKQDEFWRNKLLNMQSVKAQIGEIAKGRHGKLPTGEELERKWKQ